MNEKKEKMTKSSKNKIYSDIFNFNTSTYYRWKKEGRPIVAFLNKYFNESDINEFLETGKMSKLEALNPNSDLSMLHDELASIKKEIGDLKRVMEKD
ncbi:MAG: hypothetical protein JXQ76_10890 [Campylobacterales bacterium]|nr:hypothetical protein [Campylobacterales bacterium]